MPALQTKEEIINSGKREVRQSWLERAIKGKSAGATLIELGAMLAATEFRESLPGSCSRCRGWRDPRRSTAQFPDVFCSETCEQEFVRAALGSLTAEDCVRMQDRLERLLPDAEGSAA